MMPVFDEVTAIDPDQFHCLEREIATAGDRNTHPAVTAAVIKWVESAIKILRASERTTYGVNADRFDATVMAVAHYACGNGFKIKQRIRATTKNSLRFFQDGIPTRLIE
jgi:hypothetical protein